MDLIRAQEAVEDILECSVCMNSFETTGPRTPKMLPCQHSFCFDCMKNMFVKKKVSCPSCRKIFATRLHDLPNCLILLQLLDFRKPDRPPNDINCERCQNPREDLKSYCTECIEELVNGRPLMQGEGECKQDGSEPSLDSTKELLQTESAAQFSHIHAITLKNLFSVVTVAGFCCFMAGVLFCMHYATIFNFILKISNVFVETATILCKLTIGYIPQAFNFLIITFFDMLESLYGILAHFLAFLPQCFYIILQCCIFCCDRIWELYEITVKNFQTLILFSYTFCEEFLSVPMLYFLHNLICRMLIHARPNMGRRRRYRAR